LAPTAAAPKTRYETVFDVFLDDPSSADSAEARFRKAEARLSEELEEAKLKRAREAAAEAAAESRARRMRIPFRSCPS
jgi:hypothetical protein